MMKLLPIVEILFVILLSTITSTILDALITRFFGDAFVGVVVYWLLYTTIVCSLIYLIRRRDGWRLGDFGLTTENFRKNILYGTVIISPLIIIEIIGNVLLFDSFVNNSPFNNLDAFEGLIYAFLIYPILSILWAEFHEEFRFRGYMQNFIGKNYNEVIALIGISIYFALGHTFSHPEYNILILLYLLIPAFILGLEFLVYRNIVVTMTSHLLINASQMWIFAVCYYFGKNVGLITALISIGIVGFLMVKGRNIFAVFIKESKKYLKTEPKNYFYGVLLGAILLVYAYLLVEIVDFLI